MWNFKGQKRPAFAIEPGPGQESVWDYPRPPEMVSSDLLVEVRNGNQVVAQTRRAMRVLETASPPTWYLPPDDIDFGQLTSTPGQSFCEWKGSASYWALASASDVAVGWSYAEPSTRFAAIAGWLSFYPGRVACTVDGEQVRPQAGGFYGGWITKEIIGPFKGDPGTGGW